MRVVELDYFAFSYINMSVSKFCDYVTSSRNMITGSLKEVNIDVVAVLNVKKRGIISLQKYRTDSDIAYVYQHGTHLVFISNLIDGWSSLVMTMSRNEKVRSYLFQLDKGKSKIECLNSFVFTNGVGAEERAVQAMIDNGKWVFYESGPVQEFESPEFYQQRLIKKRMNYDILWEYCKKLGINLEDENFLYPKTEAVVFERTYHEN